MTNDLLNVDLFFIFCLKL